MELEKEIQLFKELGEVRYYVSLKTRLGDKFYKGLVKSVIRNIKLEISKEH